MYCELCNSENCEHQDRSCPCGCGDDPKANCSYDTAQDRHLKNIMNGRTDEQWVVDMLAAQQGVNSDVLPCGHSREMVIYGLQHVTCGVCGESATRRLR
jgi:hypothetical protein